MKKEPQAYLAHIMQSIEAIERYLQGVSKETFLESEEKQDLVTRRLEVIGEAVKQLPDEFKQQYPQIPWRDIGDMRNVLIHVYFDIDYTLVWETATKLVPELKQEVEVLLKKNYKNEILKHIFPTKEQVRAQIAESVNAFLTQLHNKKSPFLLLLSGGSAFDILQSLSDKNFSDKATIAVLDERYSTDPVINNMAQLKQTVFYRQVTGKGCLVIDTTVAEHETMDELATRFDQALSVWKQHNAEGEIIAIVGMGPDGHTSGIMPFPENPDLFTQLFENPQRLTVAYDAEGKNPHRYRVTTTNTFMRQIDHAFVYAVGENKKDALKRVLAKDGDLPATPARILREMKKVDLFTDVTL